MEVHEPFRTSPALATVAVVIPYRCGGKRRLPEDVRARVALAMLGDVLCAAVGVGEIRLVTDVVDADDLLRAFGARSIRDPGDGQGGAVAKALTGLNGPCLVVNADVPAATAADIGMLAVTACRGEFGIVEAVDGTTNALALPRAGHFMPLYGPGSAARFRAHAAQLLLPVANLELPNLIDDVDTWADLERIGERAGERTRALLALATQ